MGTTVTIEKDGKEATGTIIETKHTCNQEYTMYVLDNGAGLEWQRSTNTWKLLPDWRFIQGMVPVNVRF